MAGFYIPNLEPADDAPRGSFDRANSRTDIENPSWFQQFSDRRTWSDNDWVWWPASTNVQAARYCRDNSYRIQVMYGGKTKYKKDGSLRDSWDFTRIYEYGPHPILTEDFFVDFLFAPSKGRFSWDQLDPRWGHTIPVIRLQ